MTFTRNRGAIAALVAGSCLALTASASADSLPSTHKSDAAQAGYAGATRAAATQPTTIEVVRPERTIVRDVDEALPLILSSTALLLVLAGLAVVVIRTRTAPRAGH